MSAVPTLDLNNFFECATEFPIQFRGKKLSEEEGNIVWCKKVGDRLASDESLRLATDLSNVLIPPKLIERMQKFYDEDLSKIPIVSAYRNKKSKIYKTNSVAEFFIVFRNLFVHFQDYCCYRFPTIPDAFQVFNSVCDQQMAGCAVAILKARYQRTLPVDLSYLVIPCCKWKNVTTFAGCSLTADFVVLSPEKQKMHFVNAFGNSLRTERYNLRLNIGVMLKMDEIESAIKKLSEHKALEELPEDLQEFTGDKGFKAKTGSTEYYANLFLLNRNLQDHFAVYKAFNEAEEFGVVHKHFAELFSTDDANLMPRVAYEICRQKFKTFDELPYALKLTLLEGDYQPPQN